MGDLYTRATFGNTAQLSTCIFVRDDTQRLVHEVDKSGWKEVTTRHDLPVPILTIYETEREAKKNMNHNKSDICRKNA